MLCKQCGAAIPDDAAFCVNCGASVEAVVADAPEQVVDTPAFQEEPEVVAVPVDQVPPQPPKKKKKSGCGIFIIVAVVLAALAVLGVVVVLILAAVGIFGVTAMTNTKSPVVEAPTYSIIEEVETTIPEGERTYELDSSNMYYDEFVDSESYMLSAVRDRYYSRAELSGMTRAQLYLAEREMFARYGCTFTDRDLSDYFYAKSWYSPDGPVGNFNENKMTDVEQVNLMTLRALLAEKDGTTSNNAYLKLNNDPDGWVLRTTDSARIVPADVKPLGEEELAIAAGEIYARKGYIFDDPELQMYFAAKNWYVPVTPSAQFDTAALTEIESENYTCLLACAEKLRGVKFTNNNRYEEYYYQHGDYIFPESDTRAIDPHDLKYLSHEELVLARNEIYARYGYSYNHAALREYFMKQPWYYPTVVPTKLELIHLTKIELANVKMIQAFELDVQLEKGEAKPNTKMSYYAKHDWMTMYLPAHWQNNCICIKPNGTKGDLYFYEKYNEEDNSGYLYSIQFVPVENGIPSYSNRYVELFGYVTNSEGAQYYVLKVTPKTDDYLYLHNVYDLMQSQIDNIFDAIVWKSGYTFTRA